MFFQRRCKQCEGNHAEIERLRSQLNKSRAEVERLTQLLDGSPAMPINKPVIEQQSVKKLQSEGSEFYDKSVNWEKLPLQDIERQIGDIRTKFGRNRDAIRAINELQAIQWKIIERQKAGKPIAGTNAKRSKITTSELRLCCTNRVKDVLPLTPDGFSLLAQ